jgi:nucleotide-binding universal stress UspA family protein
MHTPAERSDPKKQLRASGGETPSQYVLFPIFESHDKQTFEIVQDIAEGSGMALLVLDLLDSDSDRTKDARKVAGSLLNSKLDDDHNIEIKTLYKETTDPLESVITVARNHDTRLIVFDEHTPDSLVSPITADVPGRISDDVPCDVVTVEQIRDNEPASILVPISGGLHSPLGVVVAGAIARSVSAEMTLFFVSTPDQETDTAENHFESAHDRLPAGISVETRQVTNKEVVDAIVEESDQYDMTVIGEPDRSRLRRILFGSLTEEVSQEVTNTLLVCRRSSGQPFEFA